LSTRALREGELAVLARDLAMARNPHELLLAGVEGSSDRGRLVVRVLEPNEHVTATDRDTAPTWMAPTSAGVPEPRDLGDWGTLTLEPAAPEVPVPARTSMEPYAPAERAVPEAPAVE